MVPAAAEGEVGEEGGGGELGAEPGAELGDLGLCWARFLVEVRAGSGRNKACVVLSLTHASFSPFLVPPLSLSLHSHSPSSETRERLSRSAAAIDWALARAREASEEEEGEKALIIGANPGGVGAVPSAFGVGARGATGAREAEAAPPPAAAAAAPEEGGGTGGRGADIARRVFFSSSFSFALVINSSEEQLSLLLR